MLVTFDREKGVVEDVVCYPPALGDARGLVEVPVDAEINAALTVLLFSLR